MIKVTKAQAKRLFNKGAVITFVPSKSNWQSMLDTSDHLHNYDSFEDACKEKENYYCSKIHGLRLAFYISEYCYSKFN